MAIDNQTMILLLLAFTIVEIITFVIIIMKYREAKRRGLGIFSNDSLIQLFEDKIGIFDSIDHAIFQLSLTGTLVNVNRKTVSILEFPSVEIMRGVNLLQLVENIADRQILEDILSNRTQKSHIKIEISRFDGKKKTFLMNLQSINNERGSVLTYLGVLQQSS
ncbi:MAG: PAS domain-containing protein [Candidatus Heimdallarchaeota archaeon]|nr:PAS domain-containing protein [Candidatus Heimdallarchaeota archaeon]